jgi:hypothetical protein
MGNGHQRGSSGAAQTDAQKGNRLRKACDSCSIRKVKVRRAKPYKHATNAPPPSTTPC